MGLEDAKAFGKDIYALIVDSTAFDTPDHKRMLWVMNDLGFSTDANNPVKNVYEMLPLKSNPTPSVQPRSIQSHGFTVAIQ
eukprot:961023-Pelagomonas_calceolata.AAC.4